MKRLLVCLAALLLAGCGGKSYVVLLDNPDGTTGAIVVHGARGEQRVATAGFGVPLDGSKAPQRVDPGRIEEDFKLTLAAQPPLPERFLLYFELGNAKLTRESQAQFPRVASSAAARPAPDISVIGHTDTLGQAELNEELARARAETVARLLRASGIGYHALQVESHGERNPLVRTPDNTPEPKNRRVEISVR